MQGAKEIEEGLNDSKCENMKIFNEFVDMKRQVLELNKLSFQLNPNVLDALENDIRLRPISKNELLQVIIIHKSKYNQKVINDAPDKLNYKDFTRLIFVDRIETDEDGYLFELLFEKIMKAREDNQKVKEKMDSKLNEILPNMPSYNIKQNEYGNIVEMQQVFSKPKLTLIPKGGEINE